MSNNTSEYETTSDYETSEEIAKIRNEKLLHLKTEKTETRETTETRDDVTLIKYDELKCGSCKTNKFNGDLIITMLILFLSFCFIFIKRYRL